jgi:hypothetical protein
MKKTRTLSTGRVVTLHGNDGVRKRCDCPRRAWATCAHPWHFAFKWQGIHYRFPLGRAFTWKGKSYRFPSEGDVTSRVQAKTEADKLRAAIRERGGLPGPVTSAATAADLTFEQFATKWRENARAHDPNVGESERLNDRATCTQLAKRVIDGERFGDRSIGRITEDDWEAVFRQLSTLAASTWNKYRDVVRMLQAWGVEKGYLARPWVRENNSLIAHRSDAGDKRNRRLVADVLDDKGKVKTPGEERRLLARAGAWLKNLIIAALDTGMRRGELLSLQWADVSLSRGLLIVRSENAKSGKARQVPISPRLRGILGMINTDPDGRHTSRPRSSSATLSVDR